MATFTQQITNYAGDVSSYSTEIDQWLDDGVKDVVRRTLVVSPDKASLFASNINFSTIQSLEDYGPVLDVSRGSRSCIEIPANLRHQSDEATSLYLATANDPVFYKLNGSLNVLPASSDCHASVVRYGYVSDSAGTILFFPDSHLVYVVYFASSNALHAKMIALTTGLATAIATLLGEANTAIDNFSEDVGDEINKNLDDNPDFSTGNVAKANAAILKANNYLSDWNADGDAMNTDDNDEDRDFEFMMYDEDTEIASLALNGAATQLSIAQMELGKITSLLGSSANYLQVAQSYLGEATNRLNKDQLEYQWLTSQLAYVKGQYDAAFSEGT